MYVLVAGHAVAGGHDYRVRQVQACQLYRSFGQPYVGGVLSQSLCLLVFRERCRLFHAAHLFVFGVKCVVFGLYPVVLLPCHGVFLQQFAVPFKLLCGVGPLHAHLFYRRVVHANVVLRCGYAGVGHLLSGKGVGKVGLGLRQAEPELGVFYNEQGVALVHGLVLFEVNLLDEALHAGVHRRDVLLYLCVVGVLDVAKVDEARAYVSQSGNQQRDYDCIVN